MALGGDTVEELQRYYICKPIMYSDGIVLLGGGPRPASAAGHVNAVLDEAALPRESHDPF